MFLDKVASIRFSVGSEDFAWFVLRGKVEMGKKGGRDEFSAVS